MKEYLTYKRTVRNECLRNAVAAVGHYNLFLQITGFLFLTFKFKKKKIRHLWRLLTQISHCYKFWCRFLRQNLARGMAFKFFCLAVSSLKISFMQLI